MVIDKNLCEIGITYTPKRTSKFKVSSSQDAEIYLRETFKAELCNLNLKEYFYILLLNKGSRIIGFHRLSEGNLDSCMADRRLAFATALKCLASGIILCHNHPSGRLKPSEQDRGLTRGFVEAGKLIDIMVLDHIILAEEGYYSFADNGMM
jgi:DNA repair protein RadC